MAYREHLPAPALRQRVACYWTMGSEAATREHRVLPDGCMDILLAIGRGGAIATKVVGTMTRAIVTSASTERFVGIRFLPGEAHAFLNVRADEAVDLALDPQEAGAVATNALEDAVRASLDDPRAALDRWLLDRASRARSVDSRVRRAVSRILASHGKSTAAAIADDAGLSERQLERLFAERVGVGPKVLARIMRLQAMVARIGNTGPRIRWADLAAEHGYSDQAHLVREVRALAGVPPTALVREREAAAEIATMEA